MRLPAFALTLLAATAASGLTIDFDNLPGLTPIPYVEKAPIPTSARLKSLDLPGGGSLRFTTDDAAKYVALVVADGRVGIMGASKKGKLKPGRLVDVKIKDAPDWLVESFLVAGAFRASTAPATDPFTGTGAWIVNAKKQRYPPSGGAYGVGVSGVLELSMATIPDAIVRVRLGSGTLFLDSLVLSGGAAPLQAAADVDVPEPGTLGLVLAALGALGLRRR